MINNTVVIYNDIMCCRMYKTSRSEMVNTFDDRSVRLKTRM